MKTTLATKQPDYSGDCTPCSPSKPKKTKIVYPSLRIELDKENQDLVKALGANGTATITYSLKELRIGNQYGGAEDNDRGCITLEVTAMEFPDKTTPIFKDAGAALDAFAKEAKADKGSINAEEEEGEE